MAMYQSIFTIWIPNGHHTPVEGVTFWNLLNKLISGPSLLISNHMGLFFQRDTFVHFFE